MSNTHTKLLAIDFLSLKPTVNSVTRAETLGVVTTYDVKPSKYVKFTIDDTTGSVPCILWLNHLTSPYFARRSPGDVRIVADVAKGFAETVRIGEVVRVRGKVGVFRESLQVTVTDVVVERDPNAETLFWLECVRLSRRRRKSGGAT